jgi:hypothetical protein
MLQWVLIAVSIQCMTVDSRHVDIIALAAAAAAAAEMAGDAKALQIDRSLVWQHILEVAASCCAPHAEVDLSSAQKLSAGMRTPGFVTDLTPHVACSRQTTGCDAVTWVLASMVGWLQG